MIGILRERTYRHLFLAQVVALVGTGLATVALGLLAYDIAGGDAGRVLGIALAIKMLAYVLVSPLAAAVVSRWPRKRVLVTLDLVRIAIALALPWVDAVWQIYVLIFVLQASSAAFTPTFQATIPEVLPRECDYTRALSLSRLAYDLESLLSPMLAAAALAVVGYSTLFYGTAFGFMASALFVVSVTLPKPADTQSQPFRERLTRGLRIYLATPRLRGLLALNLAAAAGGAMVIVNTIVMVRGQLGLPDSAVAWALAAFGAGSMVVALALPRWLDRHDDRTPMLLGAAVMAVALLALAVAWTWPSEMRWPVLLVIWAITGAGYAAIVTPSGRLLRRSASSTDLPAVFAAQFSLSHGGWLLTYPLAGILGASAGISITSLTMAALAVVGAATAWRLWPAIDPEVREHHHPELPSDAPHLTGTSAKSHAHRYLIDELHPRW